MKDLEAEKSGRRPSFSSLLAVDLASPFSKRSRRGCEGDMSDQGEDDLLALLKRARMISGLPLDFWADLTEGLPYSLVAILCGRSSIFPKYMNSNDKP